MVKWNTNLVNAFPDPYLKAKQPPPPPSIVPTEPFPFLKLPSELRNRIYALVLFTSTSYSTGTNTRTSLLLASHRLHAEASYILYSTTTFRIFPLQDFDPLPTVRDLPYHYRKHLTSIELVLGPSWTAPPKSWKVIKSMARALGSMGLVQTLRVFVEIDPSHPVFSRFRVSHDFYSEFCGGLLGDVLKAMPKLKAVQIAGRPSVQRDGPLVSRLRREVEEQGRLLKWGEMGQGNSVEEKSTEATLFFKHLILGDSILATRAAEVVTQEA